MLGADPLADEQHRRLVHLAFADDDRAVDRKHAQLAPHGVDGGTVGFLLQPAAAQPRRGNCGAFGYTGDFKRQRALKVLVRAAGIR